jgi:hypothetical protein
MIIQIYEWHEPHTRVTTIDGSMEYKDWLLQEQERLLRRGREPELRYKENKVALFADKKGFITSKGHWGG